ncbi:zinc-binding dehydrogenase [Nonomuraea sp. NPDC050786]|uniref:zinc-binding dehydrogenase n=1 Tax=Nonomuraea sp. NPDC050786 TaxID=3154840 RepID=UPI0033CA83CB
MAGGDRDVHGPRRPRGLRTRRHGPRSLAGAGPALNGTRAVSTRYEWHHACPGRPGRARRLRRGRAGRGRGARHHRRRLPRALTALVEAGKLRVEIAAALPLAEAAKANELGETNRTTGKIVLTVAH